MTALPPELFRSRSVLLSPAVLLLISGLLWLLLGLSRPPHLDEESYLFLGHVLQGHPLRPYDWWRPWPPYFTPRDTFYLYAHPPLFLWWSAGWQALLGSESLWLLRLVALPLVWVLCWSWHGLARLFLKRPLEASAVLFVTPAVGAICAQSLMPDLLMGALLLLALRLGWETAQAEGLSRAAQCGRMCGAGMLFALASLVKYPVLGLLPLALFFPARVPERRLFLAFSFWGGAGLLVLSWQGWTSLQYGTPHLYYVLSHAGEIARSPFPSRLLGGLTQLGLTVMPPLLLLLSFLEGRWRLRPRRGLLAGLGWSVWVGLVVLVLLLLLGAFSAEPEVGWLRGLLAWTPLLAWVDALEGRVPLEPLNLALWWGGVCLGLLSLRLLSMRTPSSRFLSLWALLWGLIVLLGHNFASARYAVWMGLPLQLLLLERRQQGGVRGFLARVPERWTLGAVLLASLLLTVKVRQADEHVSRGQTALAEEGVAWLKQRQIPAKSVSFTGEWGIRAVLEREGYAMLAPGEAPASGYCVRVLHAAPASEACQQGQVLRTWRLEQVGFQVFSPSEGISFYAEVQGLLPYGWGAGPQEVLQVLVREDSSRGP